ncbi:MAG: hypothetical protein Q9168_003339 [Polycauliona sp. 1 TL-2023]
MAEASNATVSPVAEKSPKPDETAQAGTADEGNDSSGVSDANSAEDPKPNGAATPTKPSASGSQGDDTDMKDADDAAAAVSTPATTQTPASNKKATSGSSKKKSAVPEHKTRKLNKKPSTKRITNLDAEPGQYYLATMKGHSPWPSVICDEEMLPMSLLDTRPVTTKLPDGTYKKAEYADGGKRAHDRTFPIMFLHTNEFAWMPNTALNPLETAAIDPADTKGKSKPLIAAYVKASEENDLQHYKDMLADHQKAVEEEQEAQKEAQTERDTKKSTKSTKSKRKSVDASATPAGDDGDEMDVDEEEEEPKPKSKKRKKEVESDAEEKPAKTPKTATKLKLSTPKTPVETSSKKKMPKQKASSKKAAPKESDDEDVDTPKVEEKRMTAEEAKNAKEKKVLWFRHKLQRGFLSRDVPPKEDEMKQMSEYLGELETFLDLEPNIIRSTKINKVLKAMIKIPSIPQDEIHQFKDRSLKILAEWNKTLSNEPGNDAQADKEDDAKEAAAVPTINGTSKDTEDQAAKADAGEAAAPEDEKDNLENKIGTTIEGEKEAEKSEGQATEEAEKVSDDKGDAPDVENAPAKEYQPPVVETA